MYRIDLIARFWRFWEIARAKGSGYCQKAAIPVGVAFTIFGADSVRAQLITNGSIAELSLADAKRVAFLRNWDLLAAKTDVELATAQRVVAREFPNPVASFSVQKINVDN